MRNRVLACCTLLLGFLAGLLLREWVPPTRSAALASFSRTVHADLLRVHGEYALILPSPHFMEQAFGPNWRDSTMYYFCNRALTLDGGRAIVGSGPYSPTAKGNPVIDVSGDDWKDLRVSILELESRRQAFLEVDLAAGKTKSLALKTQPPKELQVNSKGELIVWY